MRERRVGCHSSYCTIHPLGHWATPPKSPRPSSQGMQQHPSGVPAVAPTLPPPVDTRAPSKAVVHSAQPSSSVDVTNPLMFADAHHSPGSGYSPSSVDSSAWASPASSAGHGGAHGSPSSRGSVHSTPPSTSSTSSKRGFSWARRKGAAPKSQESSQAEAAAITAMHTAWVAAAGPPPIPHSVVDSRGAAASPSATASPSADDASSGAASGRAARAAAMSGRPI